LSKTDANNSFDISGSTIANTQQASGGGSGDELTGGAGNDDFLFAEDADFGDTITDFDVSGDDQIALDIGSAGIQTGSMTGGVATQVQTGTSNASIASTPGGNALQTGTGGGNTGIAVRVAAPNLSGVALGFVSANNTKLSAPTGSIFQGAAFTSADNNTQFANLINNATPNSNFTNSNVPVNSGIFGAIALTNGGTNLVAAVIDNPSGTVSAQEIALQTIIASFSGGGQTIEDGDLFLA